jgi:hypothetical protein
MLLPDSLYFVVLRKQEDLHNDRNQPTLRVLSLPFNPGGMVEERIS